MKAHLLYEALFIGLYQIPIPPACHPLLKRRSCNRNGGGPAGHVLHRVGGTHASPRLHWRRGHIRHLRSGRKVPVRPTLVGLAERGFIDKDYAVSRHKAEGRYDV